MAASNDRSDLDTWLAAVDEFAAEMKDRIRQVEASGDRREWRTWTVPQLLARLFEETGEVLTALSIGTDTEQFVGHCADAANYNMILAYIARRRGLREALPLLQPEAAKAHLRAARE